MPSTRLLVCLCSSCLSLMSCTGGANSHEASTKAAFWRVRESAYENSQAEASKKCNYVPGTPSYLIDDNRDVDFNAAADSEYLRSLRDMLRDDQAARDFDSAYDGSQSSFVNAVDKANLKKFKELIRRKGFPTTDSV